jgi:hypothetical protein
MTFLWLYIRVNTFMAKLTTCTNFWHLFWTLLQIVICSNTDYCQNLIAYNCRLFLLLSPSPSCTCEVITAWCILRSQMGETASRYVRLLWMYWISSCRCWQGVACHKQLAYNRMLHKTSDLYELFGMF